jgi:hypothetical protein
LFQVAKLRNDALHLSPRIIIQSYLAAAHYDPNQALGTINAKPVKKIYKTGYWIRPARKTLHHLSYYKRAEPYYYLMQYCRDQSRDFEECSQQQQQEHPTSDTKDSKDFELELPQTAKEWMQYAVCFGYLALDTKYSGTMHFPEEAIYEWKLLYDLCQNAYDAEEYAISSQASLLLLRRIRNHHCPNIPEFYEQSTRKLYTLALSAVQQDLKGIGWSDLSSLPFLTKQ